MKKYLFAIVLLAIGMASCSKKDDFQNTSLDSRIMTIYADCVADEEQDNNKNDVVSKTSYAGDQTFSWTAGDKISVLFHNDLNEAVWVEFTASTSAAASAFTGYVAGGLTIGAPTTGTQWAMYPASDNHTYSSDTELGFYMPNTMDGNTAKIPMIANLASGSTDPYHFRQLGGAIKMTINNIREEVSNIKVQLNTRGWVEAGIGYKYVTGTFSVVNPSSATPSIVANPGTTMADGAYIISATASVNTQTAVVYLPIPVLEMWPSYDITLFDADKGIQLYSKSIKSGGAVIDVKRQRITPLSALTLADIDRSSRIQIDGYFSSDWTGDGISTFASSRPSRIMEWKSASDASNLYFYFKIVKANVTSSRWGTYICTGIDLTDGGSDPGYNLGGGKEVYTITYPFAGAEYVMINGTDDNSDIQYPVGTSSGVKITTSGAVDGDYVYVEMSIPRSAIGSPSAGTIKVQHSLNYYEAGEQSITII